MSRGHRPPPKDMYWFAHGGPEGDQNQRNSVLFDGEEEASPTWNTNTERRASPDEQRPAHVPDGSSHSSGPPSLERDDRLRHSDKRIAVEERRKQLWEAEQERNDAVLRKHMEREAALEARRNASRSTIAFAFGSCVPRNVDTLQEGGDADIMSRSFTCGSSHRGEDLMSKSMIVSSAPRGRRKNDLMPTVPYERQPPTPRVAATASARKRSVSMTRLDQLALPRKHYLEANKAASSASSANSSMHKDTLRSPTRPLSSASENSGGSSGRAPGPVTRRIRSTPRKPRPVSIAGTLPEQRQVARSKPLEVKAASPAKKSYTPSKLTTASHPTPKASTPKSTGKAKQPPRLSTPPKITTSKPSTPRTTPKTPRQIDSKQTAAKPAGTPISKVKEKKPTPAKKKTDVVTPSPSAVEVKSQVHDNGISESPSSDVDVAAENEKNNAKRIISEEEAKAALAEKRRLAREQAEKEAELEKQKQEQLRLEEEERLRQEEEDHRKMAEEQMRLLEEHRRQEEQKLRKAIEDQEQKEEEEKARRDEEIRLKAEQEKKAKEEAEKQKLELEEKLRKEEEERAERKKRLEKIMSRTRGKSNGTSPNGSMSGSDHLDSGDNPQEGFSSGANSLDSNEADLPSEQASMEDQKMTELIDANRSYNIGSENASLNSNDLMMPVSESPSQDNSLGNFLNKDGIEPVVSQMDEKVVSGSLQGIHDNQETVEVEVSENIQNHLVDEHKGGGMEAMMTRMIGEPQHTEKVDLNVVASKFLNQDSHFEGQQNLFESSERQPSFDQNDTVLNQQALVKELPHQHDLEQNYSPFQGEFNVEAPALDSDMLDHLGRSSVSSDIKLPDPIYETSEDGSISSEKHQTFGMQEDFEFTRNQGNISDDIFPLPDPASDHPNENPFEANAFNANQNPFSDEYAVLKSNVNFQDSFSNDSILESREESVLNHEHELKDGQEVVPPLQPNNTVEFDVHQNETVADKSENNPFNQGDNENNPDEISDYQIPQPSDPFMFENGFSHHTTEKTAKLENFEPTSVLGQVNFEKQIIGSSFEEHEVDDVTLIKSNNDGACVGIISSIDHDQISNSFPKPNLLNEQFRNDFQSASMTDSEDNSSMDSNLSQVMTVEGSEKDITHDLNKLDISQTSKNGYSNGKKHNPFDIGNVYNDSISKSGVNNYHASEVFSNGQRVESLNQMSHHLPDYVHPDGNGTLPVEHGNMFESGDAIHNGKGSLDPFLAKGNSNPANPFLLQDEQKQVLVTSDFLN